MTLCAIFALLLPGCAGGVEAPEFVLQADNGRPWSLDAQKRGVVLFFGYTHCADTCPLTLAKLARAIETSKRPKQEVEVAFITVDPQRDTPNVLHRYLARFGSEFVGLTGSNAEIGSVERSYHVWAARLPAKRGKDEYDEAHTSTMFFVEPNGRIASLHDATDSVSDLARDLP